MKEPSLLKEASPRKHEELRVSKQTFIDIMVKRYKRVYVPYPDYSTLKRVREGAELDFDRIELEGLILLDKKAIGKREEECTLRTTSEVRHFIRELLGVKST